jgi:hypothetical protein
MRKLITTKSWVPGSNPQRFQIIRLQLVVFVLIIAPLSVLRKNPVNADPPGAISTSTSHPAHD